MKKALPKILTGILVSLLVCFLASCQDLTGPQGEPGVDGRDAVLPPDIGEALSSALVAKTGGDGEPWAVKISGLDLSDAYTARQIFHGVAAAIPEGDIDLDLSECTGAFFGYDPGVSLKDKARYTGLTLPDSLTHINDGKRGDNFRHFGAFADFTNLKRISAAGLLRVGNNAFLGCAALETLDLPTVTDIGAYAFCPNPATSSAAGAVNNTVLETVDLPRVETIGEKAFFRCIAIAELNLPEVLRIEREAFAGYAYAPNVVLETVDLPSAEFIGISAFQYCPAIKTISLPNVQEILGQAFGTDSESMFCPPNTVLEYVELPEASVVGAVFYYCTALKKANLPVAGSIGISMFEGCAALTEVNAPEATSVGDNAFSGCTSLVSLDLPRVRSFGASAFKSCTALTTLNTSEIIDVGVSAFDGCTALVSLELTNARSLGSTAFTNCTNLTSLKLGPNVPTWTGTTAAHGFFVNTGSASAPLTILVPAASLNAYTTATWQYNTSATVGWVSTAANGEPVKWGTNHKEIIMDTY
jgi:hypothetical protein